MARQEVKYICEICGLKHLTINYAEKCEKDHFQPVKILDAKYDLSDNKSQFPLTINIMLQDKNGVSKIITYSRK